MSDETNHTARLEELQKSELFCRIDESTWQVICEEIDLVGLKKGQALFREGDSADAIYVLIQGELEITKTSENGRLANIGEIKPYMSVGEIQVLRGGRLEENIHAASDCRLLRIPKAAIENLSINTPAEFQKILEVVRQRVREDQLRVILPKIFGALDEKTFLHIKNNIEWIHLNRRAVLCREGDPGDAIYIIISGRLRAVKDHGGPDEKKLNDMGRGEILGEMAFLTGGVRSAMLYAVRDTELVKISRATFEIFANENPRTLLSIGQTLARRMLKAESAHRGTNIQLNLAIVDICDDAKVKTFIESFTQALSAHGAMLHLNSSKLNERMGIPEIATIADDDPLNIKLSAWFDEQESRHDIMAYESDTTATNWTKRCVRNADKVLLIVDGTKLPAEANKDMLSLLQQECPELSAREIIFIHSGPDSKPHGTIDWLNLIKAETHYHIRQNSEADMHRVIRFLMEKAYNLVLSGGAACGLAHMGVIRALEENGIPIDSISGTSMGAVIASQYAMGMGCDDLLKNNLLLWVSSKPMRDLTVPFISFLRGQKLERIAKWIYGDARIEDLWRPFFCVSTSLTSNDQVVHRKGPLYQAIRATTSVPGLVPPAIINNEILVDGGIMNNLPVAVARRFFKGPVIAVDVTEAKVLRISEDGFPSPWKHLCQRLLPSKRRDLIPGIFDIMYHSAVVGSQRRTEQAGKDADYYLRLPLDRFKFLEFDAFDEIVELGYRFSNEKIMEWKKKGLADF